MALRSSVLSLAAHPAGLRPIVTGISTAAVLLGPVVLVGRMLFATAGDHRYFSHRDDDVGPTFQLLLALGGLAAAHKGRPLALERRRPAPAP